MFNLNSSLQPSVALCAPWPREYPTCKSIIAFLNSYTSLACRIKGHNAVFIGTICMFEASLHVSKSCVHAMTASFSAFLLILSVASVFWGCIFSSECLWVHLWMVFGFEESCYLGRSVVMVCSELVVWKCGFIGGSSIGDRRLFRVWLLGAGVYFFVALLVVELWRFERLCPNFAPLSDPRLWSVNLSRKIQLFLQFLCFCFPGCLIPSNPNRWLWRADPSLFFLSSWL